MKTHRFIRSFALMFPWLLVGPLGLAGIASTASDPGADLKRSLGSIFEKALTGAANRVAPPGPDLPISGGSGGLTAEYFDNQDLRGPAKLTRVDPVINFDWGYGSPGSGVPDDHFGARWSGQIQPRFSESYVFTGNRDNGFRLWIDGQMLVDLWNNQWGNYESRPIALQAGRRHAIKIEYYEDYGAAGVSLKWRSASQPEELVPSSCLYPAARETVLPPAGDGALDRSVWFATRGSWSDYFGDSKPYDASGIVVAGSEITLQADRTDQVGVLYRKPISVPAGNIVVIRRRVFVHAASRKFEAGLTAFGVDDDGLSARKPAISDCLFNVGYRNFDYETDHNLFTLTDGRIYPPGPGKFAGGTAPTTPPLWDQWFDEEIRYNPRTGETSCHLNGQERLRLKARPLRQRYLKLMLHPYGWGTGHFVRMQDFRIAVEPGSPPDSTLPPSSPGVAKFESYSLPGHFMRHYYFRLKADANVATVDDMKFKLVAGLADPNGVSFESVNFPGQFIRASNYELLLNQRDTAADFAPDATFRRVAGLADGRHVSFESHRFPGRYVRHLNSQLRIDPMVSDSDRKDATWKLAGADSPEIALPGAAGTGLRGEYFDNRDLRAPAKVTRIDPVINFDWGYGSPDPSVPSDSFSVRWTGQIQPRFSEDYIFTGMRDNGFRLWIDGQLLVDLWNNETGPYTTKPVALKAAQRHNIKIEYYEDWGGTLASLKWRSTSQPEEVIPASQLFPAAATGPTDPGNRPPSDRPGGTTVIQGKFDRAQLLATPYQWSDNGNPLGTIVFSADGSGRATWSGDIHYWKLELPDQLMISANGTTYVTRLAYQPSDGSFSGARDRTSQVQDGTRTVLRPVNSGGGRGLLGDTFDKRELGGTATLTHRDRAQDLHAIGAKAYLAAGTNRLQSEAAIQILAEACALEPDNVIYAVDLADAMMFQGSGRSQAAALDIYEKLVQEFPQDDALLTRLVNCLSELGSFGLAMDKLAARASQSRPMKAELIIQVSRIAVASGKVARAAGILRQASKQAPGNSFISLQLAILAKELGENQEAKTLLAAVLAREPGASLFAAQARRLQAEVQK